MNINSFVIFSFFLLIFSGCKSVDSLKSTEDIIDLIIKNKGVAGNTTSNLLNRLKEDVLNEKPDLVILMVGTNDMLNSKKFVSYEDYKSNLNKIVKRIKNKKTQVLLMSPPTVDSVYLHMRHDKKLFTDSPNIKLQKIKHIIEQVAQTNETLFVDINKAFKIKKLPIHNQDNYIINTKNSNKKDGVHLTALGYKFIAENIYQYLQENDLLNTYKNIICFGDSLTKGSGAPGAGTMTGENYPSYLKIMLTKR